MGFRPAKHSNWIIWPVQFWNALDLAWHNRLRLDPRDLEILKSIPKGAGFVFAANHSDEMDPRIFMELSRRSRRRFTCMMNAEAFEDWHGLYGWFLQRLGDFSVERAGSDQAAKRYAVDVVKAGQNALIMFPEGEISYLNDQVQPFKTGAVHLALQAIIENRDTHPAWTTYVVPVAIKYRYRKPIGLILDKKMSALEKHLLIRADGRTFQERIIRIMAKILNCEELIGRTQTISEQLTKLQEQVRLAQERMFSAIQVKYPQLQIDSKARFVDRAQKAIFFLRDQLHRKELYDRGLKAQLQDDIKGLKECIQMGGWQPLYIDHTPSEERLAETVMKLEREVFKLKTPHTLGDRFAFVRIGSPIDLGRYADPYRKDPSTVSHQLAEELHDQVQIMIDSNQG